MNTTTHIPTASPLKDNHKETQVHVAHIPLVHALPETE